MADETPEFQVETHVVFDRQVLFDLHTSPVMLDMYDHWAGLRRGGAIPMRAALDPVDLPRMMLPNLALVDVEAEPLDFRYRLVGTALVEWFGHDPTGRLVAEGTAFGESDMVLHNYRTVAAHRLPIAVPKPSGHHATHGDQIDKSVMMFPLTRTGTTVDVILACVEPGFMDGLQQMRRRNSLYRD